MVRCMLAVVAVLVSGCTSAVSGDAVPGEIDVRTLDVGSYRTGKPKLQSSLLDSERPVLEVVRLADAVVNPYDIDSKYDKSPGGMFELSPRDITVQWPGSLEPIVAKFGMVMAVRTAAADDSGLGDGKNSESGLFEGVAATIIRFPDEAAAKSAGAEMDAADSAASPDSIAVGLPELPGALAHRRPAAPTIAVFAPRGPFVVAVYAGRRTVDESALVSMATKYVQAQFKALDAFRPTPVSEFDSLKQDPDNMLVRTFQPYGNIWGPSTESNIVLSARAFLNFQTDVAGKKALFSKFGIDRVAASEGNFLFRARNSESANLFLVDSISVLDHDKLNRKDLGAVAGLHDSKCIEYSASSASSLTHNRYSCYVQYRQYVAMVKSDQLIDVHQKAAAQYAVLAHNQ